MVHYGADGLEDFAIYRGSPVTTAAHVAFAADGRESVDRVLPGRPRERRHVPRRTGRLAQYSERYYAGS